MCLLDTQVSIGISTLLSTVFGDKNPLPLDASLEKQAFTEPSEDQGSRDRSWRLVLKAGPGGWFSMRRITGWSWRPDQQSLGERFIRVKKVHLSAIECLVEC
jgi:hypothetical protein